MISNIPEVSFRRFQGEADYSLILSILMKSAQADQIIETASIEDIKRWCAPSRRFDPNTDISFAALDNKGGEPSIIGFSRVSWYTGKDARLYSQTSYLLPEWRDLGIWPVMVRRNERRLQDIASGHPVGACAQPAEVVVTQRHQFAGVTILLGNSERVHERTISDAHLGIAFPGHISSWVP